MTIIWISELTFYTVLGYQLVLGTLKIERGGEGRKEKVVKEGKMWEGREKGWREKKKTSKLGGEGKEGKGVQDRGGEKRKGLTALCLNSPPSVQCSM